MPAAWVQQFIPSGRRKATKVAEDNNAGTESLEGQLHAGPVGAMQHHSGLGHSHPLSCFLHVWQQLVIE
jgi:hypothetical protein